MHERAVHAVNEDLGLELEPIDIMATVRFEPVRGAYGRWINDMMDELSVTENILRTVLFGKVPARLDYIVGWAVLLDDPGMYPVPLTPGAEVLGDLLPPPSLTAAAPLAIQTRSRSVL